jgi:PAS domain S-box-containing protein
MPALDDAVRQVSIGRRLVGLALSLVAPAIGLFIRRLPPPDLGPPYLLFCPPILVAALVGGPWSGLLSTTLCAAISAAWVSASGGGRGMLPRDAVSLAAFVLSGLLVTLLAHLHRRAQGRAAAAEREAARARLEDSEERLRQTRRDAHMTAAQLAAVIRGVQDGISLADRSGRFVLVNPAHARIHGFASADAGWADLSSATAALELSDLDGRVLPPEEWPTARVLRGESFVEWELRARRRDTGRVSFHSFGGAPIRGDGGEVELALVVTRDVTERRRAALRLEAERQRLAVTLQSIGDAVIATDVEGRVTDFNAVAERLTGWSADEARGRALSEVFQIVAEDTGEPVEAPVARVLREGVVVGLANHTALLARDGPRRPIADSAAPIRTAAGEIIGVVLVFRDQSEERRAEQAQKLEIVGRLAGGIAHDFNNLLTVILAGVAELRRSPDDAPGVREIVEEIGAAGDRARELTQRLLAFARKQVIAPVALDLGAVVHDTEKLLRRLLGEDVVLTTRLAADLWPVRCDRAQAEQIVVNLAVNARDAMPAGGHLTIATENVEGIEGEVGAEREPLPPGRWVRLTVSDDGEGMAPEVRERIFEPFFTTKELGKGTGLGLSTVYGIVVQNDGFIRVDSAPGRGTTFEIYLPEAPAEAPRELPAREHAPQRGTETILVVEDDAQVRAVTVRALRSAGYAVLVAGRGDEALEVSAREPGRIHLLVTDVVMPGLGGRAVAERIGAERPGVRVLYVSGYTQKVFDDEGELAPGVEFLAKPFTPDALLARVRAVLDAPERAAG